MTFIAEDFLEFSAVLDTTFSAVLDTTWVEAGTQLIVSGGSSAEGPWTVPECEGAIG